MKEKIDFVHHQESQLQKALVTTITRVFAYEIRANGTQNLQEADRLIQQGKKLVMISNHLSNADYPVIMQSIKSNGFPQIAEKAIPLQGIKLERHPVTKFLARANNAIHTWPKTVPTKNDKERKMQWSINKKALTYAKEALSKGHPLLIFLEGTRSRNGKLQEGLREGAHYLNLFPDTFILPIGVFGTEKILPPGIPIPRPNLANVSYGKLFSASETIDLFPNLPIQEMRRKVIDHAMRRVAALLPPQYRGVYA